MGNCTPFFIFMSDYYLEMLEVVLKSGVRDLHEAASKMLPEWDHDDAFRVTVNTFNNGLLKGYWSIKVNGEKQTR